MPRRRHASSRLKPILSDAHAEAPSRVRIQKYLAQVGVAARRTCEEMVAEGRVSINGEVVRSLPAFVDPEHDKVEVDGRPVLAVAGGEGTGARGGGRGRFVYIMLYKPSRVLATTADEPGLDRRTVVDIVQHPLARRLYPVGRLDYDATGLLLLTNDGELAHRLTHPRFGVPQVYHATVKGAIDEEHLPSLAAKLRRQAKLFAKRARMEKRAQRREAGQRGPMPGRRKPPPTPAPELRIQKRDAEKTTLAIRLHDVRSVPLQDVLLACGLDVKRVTRVGLGPLELKGVAQGAWRELDREELQSLRALKPRGEGRQQDRAGG